MGTGVMGDNEGSVNKTLNSRGKVYGKYEDVVTARCEIMDILKKRHMEVQGKPMSSSDGVMFGDLVLKLVRAAGDPTYKDSFHDLAGYSTLIERSL